MSDPDTRISKEVAKICEELPTRLNIVAILREAHHRILNAADPDTVPQERINENVVTVLREIATHAVEEFTRRTGQPFLWVDEPELPEDPQPLMTFGLDDKGNVIF